MNDHDDWLARFARPRIDADELRQIIEENSPSPQIVPGTTSRKRSHTAESFEVASAEPSDDLRRAEDA